MKREELEFDGETYLEGEFVLLNGYVNEGYLERDKKYVFNEQAYLKHIDGDMAYLDKRYNCQMLQYLPEAHFAEDNWKYSYYSVEKGVGKISKAYVWDNPPKGMVYITSETEKYLKPDLTTEWIVCIVAMAVTCIFKPAPLWSVLILIGFLFYRHKRIKDYRDYKKNKEWKL